ETSSEKTNHPAIKNCGVICLCFLMKHSGAVNHFNKIGLFDVTEVFIYGDVFQCLGNICFFITNAFHPFFEGFNGFFPKKVAKDLEFLDVSLIYKYAQVYLSNRKAFGTLNVE